MEKRLLFFIIHIIPGEMPPSRNAMGIPACIRYVYLYFGFVFVNYVLIMILIALKKYVHINEGSSVWKLHSNLKMYQICMIWSALSISMKACNKWPHQPVFLYNRKAEVAMNNFDADRWYKIHNTFVWNPKWYYRPISFITIPIKFSLAVCYWWT